MNWSALRFSGLLGMVLVSLTSCGSPTNSAQTGSEGLEPRYYSQPPAQVFKAAQEAFKVWPRGKAVLKQDPQAGTIHGYSETNLWKFQDDLYVTVLPEGARTRVDVRSKGRVGESDFGGNARNINEYFEALDQILVKPQ